MKRTEKISEGTVEVEKRDLERDKVEGEEKQIMKSGQEGKN